MRFLIVVLALGLVTLAQGKFSADPVANPKATVLTKDSLVRFTILTSRIIRLEYNSQGKFNDLATFAVVNRNLPVPPFTTSYSGNILTVKTNDLKIVYVVGSGAFSESNINITLTSPVDGKTVTWYPGLAPTGNLLGTVRTLDDKDGSVPLYCPSYSSAELLDNHCTLGVISKDGWVVWNDTATPAFSNPDDNSWPWFTSPSATSCDNVPDDDDAVDCAAPDENACIKKGCCYRAVKGNGRCFYATSSLPRQDLYFFGHGHDYYGAMSEFTSITAPVPLLPRFTFGPQYSRWYAYNENDEMTLITAGYQSRTVPLDVLVLDMDWHFTYPRGGGSCHPAVNGWTGYTWNNYLFPSPSRFLSWAKKTGLHVTNNMHPAAGVQCTEQYYAPFATAMGVNPATNNSISYDIGDPNYATNFFKYVLNPLSGVNDGIDYWWIDYQQGETPIYPGVNPTFWVNYVFDTAPYWWAPNQRPLIMARWGGLGNHRYQTIGFSGDVQTSWESLAFQPYFTTTATNVGFQWSHDIGGFFGQPDPELYLRWIQWGTVSNILRTHCDGKFGEGLFYREIWKYPSTFYDIMRDAFVLRSRLVPYIYSAAFNTYATGAGILRGLYYDYPQYNEAYSFGGEYLFGSEIVAAPITVKSNNFTIAPNTIWIPPGTWIEWYSGKAFTGPITIDRNFTLEEIPIYVRAGATIPLRSSDAPVIGAAQQIPASLYLMVFPGLNAGDSHGTWYYDDDGKSTAYQNGAYTTTTATLHAESTSLTYTISGYDGGFDEMPSSRDYTIKFVGVWPPSTVMVNGVVVPFSDDDSFKPITSLYGHKVDLGTPSHRVFHQPSTSSPSSRANNNSWQYEGSTLSLIVKLSGYATNTPTTVTVNFTQSIQDPLLTSGFSRKLFLLQKVKDILDEEWELCYPEDYPHLLLAADMGNQITSQNAFDLVNDFNGLLKIAINEVNAIADSPITEQAWAFINMLQ